MRTLAATPRLCCRQTWSGNCPQVLGVPWLMGPRSAEAAEPVTDLSSRSAALAPTRGPKHGAHTERDSGGLAGFLHLALGLDGESL